MQQMEGFPVLGIHEFSESGSPEGGVLFHELHGERSIEAAHKHDFFIVMLFEKGAGTHTIDFVEYPIAAHQLHLVFPGQVHQWNIAAATSAYQVMLGRVPFEAFLPFLRFSSNFYQQHPVIDLAEDLFQALLYEFRCVQKELLQPVIFWEMLKARCEVISLQVRKAVEARFQDHDLNPLLTTFLRLLEAHYKTQRSVAFYAGEIRISPNYLNMLCRKALHTSASSLIQNRVLLEAKRLLKASGMTVKEIVFALGFYDHANFAKFFKTHTGMSPSEFKEH